MSENVKKKQVSKEELLQQMLTGFKTDEKKEIDGEIVRMSNDGYAKIARWNNPEHAKVTNRLRRPYMNGNRFTGTDEQANDIMRQGMAEAILIGVHPSDPNDLITDMDFKLSMLQSKDFLLEVFEIANDRANFLAEEKEKDAKN